MGCSISREKPLTAANESCWWLLHIAPLIQDQQEQNEQAQQQDQVKNWTKDWTWIQSKVRRGWGAGGVRRRNTGEGTEWSRAKLTRRKQDRCGGEVRLVRSKHNEAEMMEDQDEGCAVRYLRLFFFLLTFEFTFKLNARCTRASCHTWWVWPEILHVDSLLVTCTVDTHLHHVTMGEKVLHVRGVVQKNNSVTPLIGEGRLWSTQKELKQKITRRPQRRLISF